jgi:arylsulfatase A
MWIVTSVLQILLQMKKLTVLLSLTVLCEMTYAQNSNPNVLIIFSDDLGYGDLGCYGATKLETPNIDRFADEGIRFINAYVLSSTCSQSRYGLMTGRYWWHSPLHPPKGVVAPAGPNVLIEEGVTPMPKVFGNKGYETAVFGKWHLGFGSGTTGSGRYDWNQKEIKNGPLDVGFDYYFGIVANVNNEPSLYVENRDFVGRNAGDKFIIKGNKTKPWSTEVIYKPDEALYAQGSFRNSYDMVYMVIMSTILDYTG